MGNAADDSTDDFSHCCIPVDGCFAVSVCGGMRLAEDRKFRGGLSTGLGLVSFRL